MRRWLIFLVKVCLSRKIPGKTTGKYLFQGQSVILEHWFDVDIKWVEENFSTRELQFYNSLFQTNIKGQYGLIFPIFPVTIVNTK